MTKKILSDKWWEATFTFLLLNILSGTKKRFHFINDVLFQGMLSMLFIIRDSIHIRKTEIDIGNKYWIQM